MPVPIWQVPDPGTNEALLMMLVMSTVVKIKEMWRSNRDIRLVTLESPQDLASEAGGLCTALDRKARQGLLQNAQTTCSHS